MTTYFVAETNANDHVNNDAIWTKVNAKTLAGAKRAASAARMFQGTAAHVAIQNTNGEFIPVAVNRPADAINMASSRSWKDL